MSDARSLPGSAEPSTKLGVAFWIPVVVGALLRLFAAIHSDTTPGDDALRLIEACRWAAHPHWVGLSGIWSPLFDYTLGSLIRLTGDPWLAARILGWASTTLTMPFFFLAVREAYGDRLRAGWATLLLALFYVHIWMAGTAFAEGLYSLALFVALWLVLRGARRGDTGGGDLVAGGLVMLVALLLRHEAKLVWAVVIVWLAVNAGVRSALRFGIASLPAVAWQLLEPTLRGGSFAQDAALVRTLKITEMELHGTKIEALRRWIVMPAASPSIVVLVLGLTGLWTTRRFWRRDLMAWLFAVQIAFFFGLTIYPGWQPYLRYMFLYFVFLLPHAGLVMHRIASAPDPVVRRVVIPLLVALIVATQALGWWKGRNEGRPFGWLPLFRAPATQADLDRWARGADLERRFYVLSSYPQAWDITTTLLRAERCAMRQHFSLSSFEDQLALGRGERIGLRDFDAVLLDPAVPIVPAMMKSLPARVRVEFRSPRLVVLALPDSAR